jgi:hypothetical protein
MQLSCETCCLNLFHVRTVSVRWNTGVIPSPHSCIRKRISHIPWELTFQSLLVTGCTNKFNILTIVNSAHTVFTRMCFVFVCEQTATCATYSINWLVFITEMESVYSAVRTGSLSEAVCACATYSINWLVFITEMKSVYSAVRTGSLNEQSELHL